MAVNHSDLRVAFLQRPVQHSRCPVRAVLASGWQLGAQMEAVYKQPACSVVDCAHALGAYGHALRAIALG